MDGPEPVDMVYGMFRVAHKYVRDTPKDMADPRYRDWLLVHDTCKRLITRLNAGAAERDNQSGANHEIRPEHPGS